MNKPIITTAEGMSEEQIKEDISMTPLERLNLAFKISDFALAIRPSNHTKDESSSIQWIELHRILS